MIFLHSDFQTSSFLAFIIIAIATNSIHSILLLIGKYISNCFELSSSKTYFNVFTTLIAYKLSTPLTFIESTNLNISSSIIFAFYSIIVAVKS